MLLPRICAYLSPYLPQLFYIFARAVCWDQLRDFRQKSGSTQDATSASREAASKMVQLHDWDVLGKQRSLCRLNASNNILIQKILFRLYILQIVCPTVQSKNWCILHFIIWPLSMQLYVLPSWSLWIFWQEFFCTSRTIWWRYLSSPNYSMLNCSVCRHWSFMHANILLHIAPS
jgi:hypothetical protein